MSQSIPLSQIENLEESIEQTIFINPQDLAMHEDSQAQNDDSQTKNEIQNDDGQTRNDTQSDQGQFKGSSQLDEFIKNFEQLASPEDKVLCAVDFMRSSLSQTGSPYFKGFWEARKLCLPFFRDVNSSARSQLWNEYIELTKEGRRLKVLLDEESAFAVEQIEMAINALEQEVEQFENDRYVLIEKIPSVKVEINSKIIEEHQNQYIDIQEQLNLLNTYASRINALRKELIKTEIRIRQKNKFFQRLSAVGDRVFPKRKDLIKEVSELFIKDVTDFVHDNFSSQNFVKEKIQRSLFFYREEIKTLQAIAKILTLNTHAFSATREQLSHAWDQLKGMEKEIRKEVAQQRACYRQNYDQVKQKLNEFADLYATGQLSLNDGFNQIEDIVYFMRNIELGKDEVRLLREELKEVKRPLIERSEQEEKQRRTKEQEVENEKRERHQLLKQKIETLSQSVETGNLDELSVERETLLSEVAESSMTKGEKQILERNLKRIRDLIAEKKEKTMVELSQHDRESIEQLQQVLNQRKERRNEIKIQVEEYRKLIGSSGLDFEKAMSYNELMAVEKERLDKVNQGIQEIEQKLKEIKKSSV